MWYECSYISRARIGVPPASPCVWSAAHWFTRRVREQDPARATAHRLAHRDELRAPALDAAEITRQRFAQRRVRLAPVAEAVEVQLVQDHRVHGDQLFPLEPVDHEDGCRGKVQRGELFGDRVQPFDRTAIVVLPVADDELLREPLQL